MKLNSYFKYKVTGFVICQITTTKRELGRMKKGSFSSNQLSKYVTSSFDLYGQHVHTHVSNKFHKSFLTMGKIQFITDNCNHICKKG